MQVWQELSVYFGNEIIHGVINHGNKKKIFNNLLKRFAYALRMHIGISFQFPFEKWKIGNSFISIIGCITYEHYLWVCFHCLK